MNPRWVQARSVGIDNGRERTRGASQPAGMRQTERGIRPDLWSRVDTPVDGTRKVGCLEHFFKGHET